MKTYWARIRFLDSLGFETGITFSFCNHEQFLKTISRFRLSKSNVIAYQVDEGTTSYTIPIVYFGMDIFSNLQEYQANSSS